MADRDVPFAASAQDFPDLEALPGYLFDDPQNASSPRRRSSCAYCGVGDAAALTVSTSTRASATPLDATERAGTLRVAWHGSMVQYHARRLADGTLEVDCDRPLTAPGSLLPAILDLDERSEPIVARARRWVPGGPARGRQSFELSDAGLVTSKARLHSIQPTRGCMKLKTSLGSRPTVFPIQLIPSIKSPDGGPRLAVSYEQGIARLTDLLLDHRPPTGQSLLYACGQVDYFTIFSFQEAFRLLGMRNLAGNAEHCLNAGAVHNELLTGQEGPFLTFEQALEGAGRFYLLNGWNGFISHPPIWAALARRAGLDAYLIEVAVTETALALATKLGPDRVLLIRPGTDPQLALSVAHVLFEEHSSAISESFLDRYADAESFARYRALATMERFAPEAVARRIAPEERYVDRLSRGIRGIAAGLARPGAIPINLPSVGLSQTKGVVAHCLWGDALAMLGRYGLDRHGAPLGGTLRVPGQINAQTEIQGLSRRSFMGRVPCTPDGAREAERRFGLPAGAYQKLFDDPPRAALDYSAPAPEDRRELFVFFGTQFESNMPGRLRWIDKLKSERCRFVVIDPIPDPFTLAHADLIIPSPPHVATTKLYQNGEWRLTLSTPRKRPAPETRSDATVVYDTIAEVSRRLRTEPSTAARHPDLAKLGPYLRERFEAPGAGGGLERIEGEVSRPKLWQRVLDYMADGDDRPGPLYCRPEHEDGRDVSFADLLNNDSVIYGGVGTRRFCIDSDDPDHQPFADKWRRPVPFRFFVPTEEDLSIPRGVLLNSGRSTLTNDKKRVRFAISTFNSGKHTGGVDMPLENPLFVSPQLAARLGFDGSPGERARITGHASGGALTLPVVISNRVKGDSVYVNFHKTRAELEEGRYLNDVTDAAERCPYTSQSSLKLTRVELESVPPEQG